MNEERGQILLLAITILAIVLILIATTSAIFLRLKEELAREVVETIDVEFANIKLTFSYALEDGLNKRSSRFLDKPITDNNNITFTTALNESFENVTKQFAYLQALKNRLFSASLDFSNLEINDSYRNISFIAILELRSTSIMIRERCKYLFRYSIITNRYEVVYD